MTTLVAENLVGGYGGGDILNGISMTVAADEIVVIVGPNGAGKSTAMKALFGLVRLRRGTVRLGDRDITNAAPQAIARGGIAYVPQERNIFPSLTIEENLEVGGILDRSATRQRIAGLYALFPPLAERRRASAGVLSGGQRQMLAVARALMMQPVLLMLDEPTAGLSPKAMDEMFEHVLKIHGTGVGILMVEQNARQALEFASRGYVLVNGRNRFENTGAELLADREVVESFLGTGIDH